ncbi:MAG: MFS transporter [Methanolinea sp.]|nr:MFS transporter [Methanolinea sp.]
MVAESEIVQDEVLIPHRGVIRVIVLIATAMAVIDGIVVSIALPTITRAFIVGIAQSQWIISAYLVTETSLLLIFGRISDFTGKRRLFLAGFILFTASSLACGLSSGLYDLVLYRILQASGAAMVFSISAAIMFEVSPRGEQGRAMGYVGATVAVAGIAAPILGGFITDSLGWEYIFLINVPIGVVVLVLAARYFRFPEQKTGTLRMDWPGSVSMVISIVSLVLLLSELSGGFKLSLFLLIYLLVFFLSVIVFLVVERKSRYPILDLSVFRNLKFTLPNAALTCIFCAFFMVNLVGPFYFEGVMNMKPSQVGLVFLIMPVIMVIASPATGWLYDRWQWDYLPVIGITLTGISMLLLAYGAISMELSLIVLLFIPLSLGSALFQSPANTEIMRALPAGKAGLASSVSATIRNLGMTVGVSLAGILLSWQLHAGGYFGAVEEAPEALLSGCISNIMVIGAGFCFAGAVLYLVKNLNIRGI